MDAIEVYVGQRGDVIIKQDSGQRQETVYVHVHPCQVATLVRWLQAVRPEAEVAMVAMEAEAEP